MLTKEYHSCENINTLEQDSKQEKDKKKTIITNQKNIQGLTLSTFQKYLNNQEITRPNCPTHQHTINPVIVHSKQTTRS